MQPRGESQHLDLKLTFDANSPKAKVELVKNLVAMANGGGGEVMFGCNEATAPGIDAATVRELDSARLATTVEAFIRPASIHISHEVTPLDNGCFVCTIAVSPVEYPIVMSRQGDWQGMNNQRDRPLFIVGDVWTRHGTRNERISYEDLRIWIEGVRQRERESVLDRISKVINVPDGAEIQIVTHADGPIDTPSRMVEYATKRRANDPNHLLNAGDLLDIFVNRQLLNINEQVLSLIIASALRRNATLYWWLAQSIDDKSDLILQEIHQCLSSKDRDKSDAGRNIIEMIAIYASEEQAQTIVTQLQDSHYSHFRKAVEDWVDCDTVQHRIRTRIAKIAKGKHGNRLLGELSLDELETLASNCAAQLIENSSSALSRKLGDITRLIWSKCDSQFELL